MHLFFSTPVWVQQINNFESINSELKNYIYQEQEKNPDGVKKSNFNGWHSENFDLKNENLKNFINEIKYVVGDEWHAGNLSYHISTRPIWYETIKGKTSELDPDGGIIYTGNAEVLKEICPGDFGKINKQGFCMIGVRNW